MKDDKNVIACTTWKGQVEGLGVMPDDGLEVIITGKLSTFGAQSTYNINVDSIEVAGAGALMAMLEKRKAALAAEGLFDPERKMELPYLPEIIGVVTSPTGAVIRDILHRLRDRFPRKVLVWPVAVQGKACAPEVANAIRGFNAMTPGGALPRPDLIIVLDGANDIQHAMRDGVTPGTTFVDGTYAAILKRPYMGPLVYIIHQLVKQPFLGLRWL